MWSIIYGLIFENKHIVELFSRLIAFILILFFLPFCTCFYLVLLLVQGSPIFYKQLRVGIDFKKFNVLKFRTMIVGEGDSITRYNDPRITKIGYFMRKFKIDEIPQLLNILNGDMRFIGPRPEVPEYCDKEDFSFLSYIKPGISDFASILFRNEDEYLKKIGGKYPYYSLLIVKIELANYYATQKSFLLDLLLTFSTLFAIVFPRYCSKLLLSMLPLKKLRKTDSFFQKYSI